MASIASSPLPISGAEDQLSISVWCFTQITAEHMDACLQTRRGLPKAEGLCNTPPSTTAVSGGSQRPEEERAILRGSFPTPHATGQSTTCSKQPGTRAKPCWDHQWCLEDSKHPWQHLHKVSASLPCASLCAIPAGSPHF